MSNMHYVLGKIIAKYGDKNPNLVAISGDVRHSTGMGFFAEKFPNRYFEMGISEQNMIGVAAGMALEGKVPFVATYAAFSPARSFEQIRNSICQQKANVKIVGAHIGFGPAKDGSTHQCFEDLALMRCLPNITIFSPFDDESCKKSTIEAIECNEPVYLRLSRNGKEKLARDYSKNFVLIKEGKKTAIISTGAITEQALLASNKFEAETGQKVAVFACSKIKPFNTSELKEITKRFDCLITLEEHQIACGFGSLVCESLSEEKQKPVIFKMGIKDSFGESGTREELYEKFGICEKSILKKLYEIKSK